MVVVGADGTIPATLRRAYGGEAGPCDPQDWWRAARTGIKELLRRAGLKPDQVRCIGITGDEACVPLDRAGKTLGTACLGPDPRIAEEVEALSTRVGARNLLNLASGPANPSCTAAKLLWLREREKRAWHDLALVLSAKDFIRYRLTGIAGTDACDAAASLLFNPRSRSWSKQLATQLGIDTAWLPAVANGQSLAGRVLEASAREAGLVPGTPVVTGAGHAAAIAVACGVLAPGPAVIELGGSGSLFMPSSEPFRDPQGRLASGCHCLAGVWAATANDLAGSSALEWLMGHVLSGEVSQARRSGRDPLEPLAELAAEVAPGADGLIHITPGPGHGGGLMGLDARHGRGHLVRSVMEGGALACRQALDRLGAVGQQPGQLIAAGPGASSNLWCQILADALDRPVQAVPVPEVAALGVAVLACHAVGVHKQLADAASRMVKQRVSYAPRRAAVEVYASLLPRLQRIQGALITASPPSVQAAGAGG